MIRANTLRPRKLRHSPYSTAPRGAKQVGISTTSGVEQRLACYFYKRDPLRYPECRRCQFRPNRLADLTNHLRRHHQQPIFCPTCGEVFEGENIDRRRNAHIVSRECQGSGDFDYPGVSRDVMDALSKAKEIEADGAATIYERRWYGRYRLLFGPEAPLPLSPHCDESDNSGLDEAQVVLNYIQSFAADGCLWRLAHSFDLSNSDELHKHFVRLISEFQQWTTQRRVTRPMATLPLAVLEAPASESNGFADSSYGLELQADRTSRRPSSAEEGSPYNSLLGATPPPDGSLGDDSRVLSDILFAQAAIPSPLQHPTVLDIGKQGPLMGTFQLGLGNSTQDRSDQELVPPDGIVGCSPFPST
ncbi:hypothetical protein N656DRAFT_300362 [Canariomyces notabilis]|uniref:C2H2-type domain-containing protein n=1 Tax=Canariomyces notabilis TaxID=2074819 RepID=A0AAN6QKI6_9PEZI|nr:hypothetical protein N656DRAFT_300362 [Canariomyces arenarius]